MSQLIRKPPGQEPVGRPPETPSDAEPPYRWRTFFIWAAGIVLLFGVLIALRELHIFPRPAGDDPEIAAAKATQQALMTAAVLTPRPTVAPTRAPTVAPTAQPATRATTALTSQPAVAPTVQPTARAESVPPPSTAVMPAIVPTGAPPEPTTAPAGAQGEGTAAGAGGAVTEATAAAAVPGVDPAITAQVMQAYQDYWSVRLAAIRDPNGTTPNLESVMADTELARARQVLTEYRESGRAYGTSIEHHVEVMYIKPNEALLVDQFTSTSKKLNPETRQPLDDAPVVEQRRDPFLLRPVDGTWKVVDEPREGS